MKWNIKPIDLELKFDWAISRSSTKKKTNLLIEIVEGDFSGKGEIAFNSRYEESQELILEQFELFLKEKPEKFEQIEDLTKFLRGKTYSNSLKFGLEAAFVDYISKISEIPICRLIGTNNITRIKTSFSVPIMDEQSLDSFIKDNNLERFDELKLKVSADTAVDSFNKLANIFDGRIRVDANESFSSADEVLSFLDKIDVAKISFLEQPLPATAHEEAKVLKEKSPVILIADESLTNNEVTDYYLERFHGINVKLMKSGSYFQALKQIRSAKELGLKVMIGCMVETSLGISQTFPICQGQDYFDLDGALLIENEPFGKVIEENGQLFLAHLH